MKKTVEQWINDSLLPQKYKDEANEFMMTANRNEPVHNLLIALRTMGNWQRFRSGHGVWSGIYEGAQQNAYGDIHQKDI